jgi:hypothetical protein
MDSSSNIMEGSSWGAFKYNLNELLGWSFGEPSAEQVQLYSDYVLFNHQLFDLINNDNYNPEKGLPKDDKAYKYCTYDKATYVKHLTISDYKSLYASSDGIFGISFFPWSPVGLKTSDGNYIAKYRYGLGPIAVNPMRKEVLMIKLITLAKIFGITFGTYYGVKLLWRHTMGKPQVK